jgi:hypothetical protein
MRVFIVIVVIIIIAIVLRITLFWLLLVQFLEL